MSELKREPEAAPSPAPATIEIWSERRADGKFYAVAQLPPESGFPEPIEKGPFDTDQEAIEACEWMVSVIEEVAGKQIERRITRITTEEVIEENAGDGAGDDEVDGEE